MSRTFIRVVAIAAALTFASTSPRTAAAQGNGMAAGISIDADGVVKPVFSRVASDQLETVRRESLAKKHLPADMNRPSKLRKVSLVRLENAYRNLIPSNEAGNGGGGDDFGPSGWPVDMLYMAGLQRIDYVFIDADEKDLVVAGPAEGFAPDGVDRMVGVASGRPPVRLDDLIVALRAVVGNNINGRRNRGAIGCSIDAVPEQLADLKQYVKANSSASTPAVAARRYQQMVRILGRQKVRTWGAPERSHFAQAMVEADYRMKLVSMELEPTGVRRFRSHLSMLRPTGNNMQRWWFTPLYDALYKTEDGDAWLLEGPRAQLMSEEEYVDNFGRRTPAVTTRVTTTEYAKHFTEKFPELAENVAVFAELQNLIDLSIVAALVKKESLDERVDWKMDAFLNTPDERLVVGETPREVDSALNYRKHGRGMVIGLLGGGVTLAPMRNLESVEIKSADGKRIDSLRTRAIEGRDETHPWWWD